MTDPTNDIDALLGYLSICVDRYSCHTLPSNIAADYYAALTALVAERNALKQRVEQLEMYQRVGRGSAADRDRELRERLVESALQGAARDSHMLHEASNMGARAVYMVDSALAAMRKGDGDA